MMVAQRLGAEVSQPPSTLLSRCRPYFNNNDLERKRAYFGLNFYAVADSIKGVLKTIPVVLTR